MHRRRAADPDPDPAATPATGPHMERIEDLVRRLDALTVPDGPGDAESVRRDLRDLGREPGGRRILDCIADRLRAAGALELKPVAVQEILQPDPIHQSNASAGGLVRTVTSVRVKAGADAVRAAVFERPWSWWRDGEILDWRAGGGVHFVLKPISPASSGRLGLPARLGIELAAPAAAPDDRQHRIVIRARFGEDFEGSRRYEILDLGDGSVLRSVWDGVERTALRVKLMPMRLFLRIHLGGEKGDLRWPLPTGTGFPGLIEALEGAA